MRNPKRSRTAAPFQAESSGTSATIENNLTPCFLNKLPNEILIELFKNHNLLDLVWNEKTPKLLIALRPIPRLHELALAVYRERNVIFQERSVSRFCTPLAVAKLRIAKFVLPRSITSKTAGGFLKEHPILKSNELETLIFDLTEQRLGEDIQAPALKFMRTAIDASTNLQTVFVKVSSVPKAILENYSYDTSTLNRFNRLLGVVGSYHWSTGRTVFLQEFERRVDEQGQAYIFIGDSIKGHEDYLRDFEVRVWRSKDGEPLRWSV